MISLARFLQAVLAPPGNLEMQVTEPGNLEEGTPSRWFPGTETFRKTSLVKLWRNW